jgi:hypothetical protein
MIQVSSHVLKFPKRQPQNKRKRSQSQKSLKKYTTRHELPPSVDFAKLNETNKRTMSSAKPLREFEQMDWVPIDYGEVFDKTQER